MTIDRLVLVPLAIGHLALFVLAVNVVHGLGYRQQVLNRTRLLLALLFAIGSGILAWEIVAGSVRAWSWPAFVYGCVCVVTALVFLPLFSAYLHLRPRPAGLEGRTTQVDLAARFGRDRLIGPGRNGWLLRLPGNESLRLRKIDWDVAVPGLPTALDGLSLLHLSDIHLSCAFERRFFEAVFDEAAGMEADLVLVTGDLLDDDALHHWVAPLFGRTRRGRIRSPGGTMGHGRTRRSHPRRGGDLLPLGAAIVDPRQARGRLLPTPEPRARPVLLGAARAVRPDALGPQPRRPDPVAAGGLGVHAEHLLAPLRPRVLPPPRPDAARQPGRGRTAPGAVRVRAGGWQALPAVGAGARGNAGTGASGSAPVADGGVIGSPGGEYLPSYS
jgi:hypothetical protein